MTVRSFLYGLSVAVVSACQANTAGRIAPESATTLRVDNQGFSDMDIFALRGGTRVRLGMVAGHQNTLLRVPPVLISGVTPLRFIADPIGSSRASVSEEINVTPGDTVMMTIPPM
jgi:hypothetical protein